ncbi:MAG TPA: glycoside hydrolase family 16 protein [Nocardioidaceae bacterium]|nr:glycoside hydrolase family 16 protein [Nocardioidaceae bacterium]
MPTPDRLDRSGLRLVLDDRFDGTLPEHWLPYHLPQWSSRAQAAARYHLDAGLTLRIDHDQQPWCPEVDGTTRVSSFQTGVFAGPLGSTTGQHRFSEDARVREGQATFRGFTPTFGLVEMRAAACPDPDAMVALWMIGFEDEPSRSAEICVAEIFGRGVRRETVDVGMGVHPFGDPDIVDDFSVETVAVDARDMHDYAALWTPEGVAFYVDDALVRRVDQSPGYPMQLMLGIYDFADPGAASPSSYPKTFAVQWVRAWSPAP